MSTLHLLCGMTGSGKTTLAKNLEAEHDVVRLSPDEWIEPLLTDKHDRTEMDRLRPHIHDLQWQLALRLLHLGCNVIWEQGFWHRLERLTCLDAARSIPAEVTLHLFDLPVAELKRRISLRNENLPSGSFFVEPSEIDEWMTWFEPPDEHELAMYDDHILYR